MSESFLFPHDGALVGSPDLLESPNVKPPANAVNDPIPTPSIYTDSRGEIFNTKISFGDGDCSGNRHDLPERINILYTQEGVMRSGDIHANFQCDFILAGSVEVWTLQKDGSTKKVTYGPKQYVEIPPFTPHIFNFVSDTVMAEWWEGRGSSSSEFRAWFYSPYRSIVEQSYRQSSSDLTAGKLKRYVEVANDSEEGAHDTTSMRKTEVSNDSEGETHDTAMLRKTQAQKWNERYEELKQYKAETGDTRISAGKSKDESYSKLGKWCDHQRQLYRLRRDGKPSSMSDERIQALEALEFQWVLQHRVDDRGVVGTLMQPTTARTPLPPRSARQVEQQKEAILSNGKKQSQKWYDNYEELRRYREEYGNCRVKAGKKKDSSYSKLGKWVDHQRQLYRLRAQGKPTSLSDERIAALDELGFEWVVVKRTGGGRPSEEPHHIQDGSVEDSEVMQAQAAAAAAAALEDDEEMVGGPHVSI